MQPLGTADYPPESESNDTLATADVLQAGTKGFTAAIYPPGETDDFRFTVPAGASLAVGVSTVMGGCPPFSAFKVEVAPVGGAPIASASGNCAMIEGSSTSALQDMPGGDYVLSITEETPQIIPEYRAHITITVPSCGDGLVQFNAGEQCDDGNFVMGDGCANDCSLEGTWLTELRANDTQATAQNITGYTGALGSITANNPDFFAVNVTVPGSSIEAQVDNGLGICWFDSLLTLRAPGGAVVVTDDDDGAMIPCSKFSPALDVAATNLPVGVYAIEVDGKLGSETPFYALRVTVRAPGCGDALLQAGEQCDDGNTTGGDGCDATCTSSAPFEIEPNGSLAQATPLWPATTSWKGSISPIGDHDFYRFTVPVGSFVTLTTHDVGSPIACTSDTVLHLADNVGAQIAQDDDGGPNACSSLSVAIGAGTYYASVQRSGDTAGIPLYQLDLTIQ